MNLYLLRHGIAVEWGTLGLARDADRGLTPKGERRLSQMTHAMEALNLSFGIILTSPYRRAKQTAEIVAEAFGTRDQLKLLDSLTPEGDPKRLIEYINRLCPPAESVLLVGHEPYLGNLIARLVSGSASFPVALKKGGLCKLTAPSLKLGHCATLEWLLTPKQMGLIR